MLFFYSYVNLHPMIKDDIPKEENEPKNFLKIPKVGDIIEGKIIGTGKASVFVDLGIFGAGIIYGREFYESRDKIKSLERGSVIFAKVIELENEDNYVELSLNQAGRELSWDALKTKKENDELSVVKIIGANKGGLLTELFGVTAFIPVSQLSAQNYPKVEGGDNQKILKALQKFVGKEMEVKIFDLDQKENKLILSEKAKKDEGMALILEGYKPGDVIEGEITGIVDFGAFVKFGDENIEGLIHISELDWRLVKSPSEVVKVGEKVKLKIVSIDKNKVSLSLKALKKDPWDNIDKKYKKGDIVKGKIIKLNVFGAFVQLSSDFQGLCHVSEFGNFKKMEKEIEEEKDYKFEIISIEPNEHRIGLKYVS
ncbi:MAG: S1 RNA-binding domain-containing protein [Candidatus Pacebacteria bacterium]|nr:S1 RNA-binding domain-containing protein [Candidatus Paceibacterota bacterium]MDD4897352.1 S1 RNA-binding domain-containing protein [Candidatus Paceibacterota bacterium]MDD5445981.1 S1 RNA-binding domain-containing protein [Candidatus Paceibacterota bacterium]